MRLTVTPFEARLLALLRRLPTFDQRLTQRLLRALLKAHNRRTRSVSEVDRP